MRQLAILKVNKSQDKHKKANWESFDDYFLKEYENLPKTENTKNEYEIDHYLSQLLSLIHKSCEHSIPIRQ
jgi:hypothetical protein